LDSAETGNLNVGDDAFLKSTRIAARQAHSLHGIYGKVEITLILTAVPMGKIPRARSSLERLRRHGTFRPHDFTITEPALREAFDRGRRRFRP
jgi:hypothetical protein